MIAFPPPVASNRYYFNPYVTTATYGNYPDPWDLAREYERQQAQRELDAGIKKFGQSALFIKLSKEERHRKAMSDARSRGRVAPTSTRRKDSRRMQTYEAAVAMRQLRR